MGINNENLLVAVKYKGVELQFRNIGEYDLKSIKNADGTQTMQITKVGSTCPKDMLQARVDATNSCDYLFYNYGGAELPDISRLDTSNVVSMNNMFGQCFNLKTLDLSSFDTSNVTDMRSVVYNCNFLISLDLSSFDTSNVGNMRYMFWSCNALTTIQGTLDLYSATNVSDIFTNTYALTGVTLKNIRTSLQIGSGTNWGHLWELSYLINAVKECWDLSEETQQTLMIGTANLEKIANVYVKLVDVTDEMIAQDPYAANKLPCVECESTDEGAMTLTAYAGLKNWGLA